MLIWESGGIPEQTLQLVLPLNNGGGGGNLGTSNTLQWVFIPKHSPGNLTHPQACEEQLPRTTLLAGCIHALGK